jgi:hypothetical protein
VPAEELEVLQRERLAPADPADAGRIADRKGRDVERRQKARKALLVLDDVEHFGERHHLDTVQLVGDERVEVVATLLAVGDQVGARLLLRA